MKKLFCLLTVLTAILCGCRTSGGGNDSYQALNDRELTHLKEYVRHNMLRDYRLTDDQRQLIEEVEPILKITYEGDKAGKAYISWNIPQNLKYAKMVKENPDAIIPYKTINIRGYGDLTDPNGILWNVSLVNQSDVQIMDKASQPNAQPTRNDWNEWLKISEK